MYELTCSVENANEGLLKYVYDEVSTSIAKVGGVCKYLHGKCRSKFALACNELYATTISRQVEDCLINALTLGFKGLYLRDSLGISDDDLLLNTLVNTMCLFDNKFDKYYVKKSISLIGEICIDGYYNFRMKGLKSKWNELVEIVKNNNALLRDTSLIKEFLCYLMDFFPQGSSDISVVIDNDTFRIFDEKGRLVPHLNLVCKSALEELVVANAICIKPKAIKLYCNKQELDEKFLDLLAYLFEVKVVQNS